MYWQGQAHQDYTELCSKSCFSFLFGASQPEEMVQRASDLGYRALSLVDRNGFYGMVRAYDRAKKLGFPVIFGSEIKVEGASVALLAKDFAGYKRICRLLSEGFREADKARPEFRASDLLRWVNPEHIQTLLLPRDYPSPHLLRQIVENLKPVQLVTRRLNPDADYQMKAHLESLSRDVPRAWSWDPFFHEASRHELFEVIQAIRENTTLTQLQPSFNSENYLKPLSYLKHFQVPKNWIHKTMEIAESCMFSPSEIRYRYPQEWLPKGKTSFEFLKELCDLGLKKRYPNGVSSQTLSLLQHELDLVKELHYEDYFLTVWDIVSFARSQKILCQGRGSAANSVICYLLEITSIDPVQMNLLFERFISKERNEAPDIDVDFEHERREEVIQYIYQKYGRHRAGMVATLITYRTRSALRDVGKALGVEPEVLEIFSKRSRWRENVFKDKPQSRKIQRLFKLAQQLKGYPRHLGQHTGGMIICQDRLDEISPIEPARMPNRSVVQWDKYDIEKLGLLKIDVLGLGMLTCLRKSFDLLRQYRIDDLELYQIPHDDDKTYEMIQQSRTVGVFQIESRAQMSMLPRLKPRNFYDLVVEIAIVRPGPIQGGMVHPYLRRRMGLEKVQYAHPSLRPILEKTMGVPIFQEQVMKMAIEVAGYTPGEADALRRAMGAWRRSGNLEKFAEDICVRLMRQGIPEDFSKRICSQILGFGEYGFPESHAASFALLTYASSYIKAHHPAVFLCALLNSAPLGFYSKHVLTSSFIRENIQILGVSLEHSFWDNTLEKVSDEWAVRLGFRNIKGLQKEHVMQFIKSRQSGDADLMTFDIDERSAIAMTCSELEARRVGYWQALGMKDDKLSLHNKERSRFKPASDISHMLLDFEFLEACIRTNPTKLLREKYWAYPIDRSRVIKSSDLARCHLHQNVFVFGSLEVVQSPPTAKGIYFFTLQDETGFLNLVMKPPVYKKYKDLLQTQWAILVLGKLQSSKGYPSILVQQIIPPRQQSAEVQNIQVKSKRGNWQRIPEKIQPEKNTPKTRKFF